MKRRPPKFVDREPVLACFGFPSATAMQRAVDELADSEVELLPIHTCQRQELYVLSTDLTINFSEAVSLGEQNDAATRLFEFAAGALSDVPGERSVDVQLHAAMRRASQFGLIGPLLMRLAKRARRTGQDIRQRVEESTAILEIADLVARIVGDMRGSQPQPVGLEVTLLGAGSLARSIHVALKTRGIDVTRWGTRRPRPDNDQSPSYSLHQAIASMSEQSVLISALADSEFLLDAFAIPPTALMIDLGVPVNTRNANWTLASIIEAFQPQLAPQAEALKRAAHRIPALAQTALAETISPSIAGLTKTLAQFREQIVAAELSRIETSLTMLSATDADHIRRSIRHAAARCTHPIHEYINELGRQNRASEAAGVIDHLLGSRVGWSDGQPQVRKERASNG